MARPLRLLVLGGASGLAVLVGGCGGSGKTGGRVAPSDPTIARVALSVQLAALRHSYRGKWSAIGSATDDLGCIDDAARIERASLATSPAFEIARRFGFRLATAVYPNAASAERTLQRFSDSRFRACVEASIVARLKAHGYRAGTPSSSWKAPGATGQAAQTAQVAVPVVYHGHPYTWHYESVTVREGRLLELVSTSASEPILAFDRRLANVLGGLAADVEHYLLTGKYVGALHAPV